MEESFQIHGTISTLAVDVCNTTAFNYAGTFDIEKIVASSIDFMHENSKCDSRAFENLLREFFYTCKVNDAVWFSIRLTKKNRAFDIPRWHRDGYMWGDNECSRKYVVSATGPATLVLEPSDYVDSIMSERCYEERRLEFAEKLKNEKRISVNTGQVISFTCGPDNSPVHSEPPMTCDRVFMSAIFTSRNQIEKLCLRRGWDYVTSPNGKK